MIIIMLESLIMLCPSYVRIPVRVPVSVSERERDRLTVCHSVSIHLFRFEFFFYFAVAMVIQAKVSDALSSFSPCSVCVCVYKKKAKNA